MERRKIRDEADARACLAAAKQSGMPLTAWGLTGGCRWPLAAGLVAQFRTGCVEETARTASGSASEACGAGRVDRGCCVITIAGGGAR
jgi:hypothetical protein